MSLVYNKGAGQTNLLSEKIVPPTPPPIAAAMMTIKKNTTIIKVDFEQPHIIRLLGLCSDGPDSRSGSGM